MLPKTLQIGNAVLTLSPKDIPEGLSLEELKKLNPCYLGNTEGLNLSISMNPWGDWRGTCVYRSHLICLVRTCTYPTPEAALRELKRDLGGLLDGLAVLFKPTGDLHR